MSAIFLRHGDQFVPMHEQPYEAEAVLQALLAEHPEVLAGGESSSDGRNWVLVKREPGIADSENGGDRWSLDHLFLDADAIPTLVEVKRSSDTRARREVVAQMLDYAANATCYWTAEKIRAWFEAECEERGETPTEVLERDLDATNLDDYWERVRINLAASRVRLVFVADAIAPELASIVEFLNREMTNTEVLAIEVKQYVDADGERQTIVPRVIGQTEAARAAKATGARASRSWDEQSLLSEIAQRNSEEIAAIARALLAWARSREDVRVEYGRGAKDGSANFWLDGSGAVLHAFNIWASGLIEVPFEYMQSRRHAPFDQDRALRDELRRRLNEAAPEAKIPGEEERARPSFALSALRSDASQSQFIAAIEWAMARAISAQRPAC